MSGRAAFRVARPVPRLGATELRAFFRPRLSAGIRTRRAIRGALVLPCARQRTGTMSVKQSGLSERAMHQLWSSLILVGLAASATICCADAASGSALHNAPPEGVYTPAQTPSARLRVYDLVVKFMANPSRTAWNEVTYAAEVGPPDPRDTALALAVRYHIAREHRDFPNSLALKKGVNAWKHSDLL